jgi:hypothetical protein
MVYSNLILDQSHFETVTELAHPKLPHSRKMDNSNGILADNDIDEDCI